MKYWEDAFDDASAATYMQTYGEGPGSPLRMFLSKLINDGETVLDVGCGPGWNFDHFLEYGPEVGRYRGLDYSKQFVRVANQRVLDRGLAFSGIAPFQEGDVREIHELNNSWDVVIFQDVLEHTNGYEGPMKEALRVARKRVIVTFWHLMDKEEDNPVNDDGDDTWGAWYSKPKWEKYLDSLDLHWLHERLPRKDAFHDVYVIDKEVKHGK